MEIFVGMYIINGLTNRNSPSEKLLSVIYGLSVINIPNNLQTYLECKKIKFTHFISSINTINLK